MEILKISNFGDKKNVELKIEKKRNALNDFIEFDFSIFSNPIKKIYQLKDLSLSLDDFINSIISISFEKSTMYNIIEQRERFDLITFKLLNKKTLNCTSSYEKNKELFIDFIQQEIKNDIFQVYDFLLYNKSESRSYCKNSRHYKKNNVYFCIKISDDEIPIYIKNIKNIANTLLSKSGRDLLSVVIDSQIKNFQNKIIPDFNLDVGDTVYILSFSSSIDYLIESNILYQILESKVDKKHIYCNSISYDISSNENKENKEKKHISLRANFNGTGNYFAEKNCFLFLNKEDAVKMAKHKSQLLISILTKSSICSF